MKLTVVILNYNVRYFLEQCIRSVKKAIAHLEAEIIVIDNDSKDGSCDMVRTLFPEISLIENKENVGFSKANNQAVRVAKGEYVCILNPDTAVAEDTFQKAIHYYESQENIGALGVYLMDGTGGFLPESKRNFPTPKASLLKLLGKDNDYYANHIAEQSSGPVEVLVGAFMLMKKSIYKEVEGFDEDYFMYGEDIDLSYKISEAGYKNHYFGGTTVLHYKGESTKRDDAYYDRFYGAMQIFYKKHVGQTWLEEKTVSLGVALAKWANRNLKSSKQPKGETPKRYIVFSNHEDLAKKLSSHYKVDFEMLSDAAVKNASIEHSFIVFDANQLSYKTIFSLMRDLHKNKNQFRIFPTAGHFIIGSDQSDEKGEVVVFS